MAKIDNPTSNIPGQLTGLHLFHFDGAPCAQRVRFALGEKGLSRGREVRFDSTLPADIEGQSEQWVSRMVSLVKKDHMTEAYLAIHPNMVGPALVHDGQLYLESLDIISYLDDAFGGARLIPDNETKTEVLALTQEAKVLHRSIRFVTFHWGLGRLAMLNTKEQNNLANSQNKAQMTRTWSSFTMVTVPTRFLKTFTYSTWKRYSAHSCDLIKRFKMTGSIW